MYDRTKYDTARRAGCTAAQALAYARNAKGCHLYGMWARSAVSQRQDATLARALVRMAAMFPYMSARHRWWLALHGVRRDARDARITWQRREMAREYF